MKLLRIHIISAKTCGGLLDGLNLRVRNSEDEYDKFDPLCFIGQNGAGKSQFLQILAELFQSVFHACLPQEERVEGNSELLFEVEYLIRIKDKAKIDHIKISRKDKKSKTSIQKKKATEWIECDLDSEETHNLLPRRIVGYTSGENETLSVPFIVSRGGYAEDVRSKALSTKTETPNEPIYETRLMMIDYATHLEVLIANLLLGNKEQSQYLLKDARLKQLHSFRCIIQLAHSSINKISKKISSISGRKGVQLTPELEKYIEQLKKCSTSYKYDEKSETYIFDFWVNEATKLAFKH